MNAALPLHKSLTVRTCDKLRDAIVSATYAPGQKLRIENLCDELDGSSSAVREALSRLTAEGLVVALPQRGFIVAPVSRRDLIDLTEVRIDIEAKCIEQAIAHGDIEWEGKVLSIRHRFLAIDADAKNPSSEAGLRWHRLHEEYHDELTSACPNLWWRRLRTQLYIQSERYRRLSGPFAEYDRDINAEHGAIADAVLARDAETAKRLITDHLRITTEILLASSIEFHGETADPSSLGD